MKLVFCPSCGDIFSLRINVHMACSCEKSWGWYLDESKATIGGDSIPIGINNTSFKQALQSRPKSGKGSPFEAFVIPLNCPTVEQEQ